MKKITHISTAIGILLGCAVKCVALKEVSSPALMPNGTVVFHLQAEENAFVGHYGETFRFCPTCEASSEMQGLTEVIRLHESVRKTDKGAFVPFDPKPGEYVPQNFTPLNLGQLIVVPKGAPNGFRSLRKLRQAKEKELALSGVRYKLLPERPAEYDLWPQDTFGVVVSTPYRLFQLYTQSDKNFFILTAGIDDLSHPDAGDIRFVCNSLQKYLRQFSRQVSEDYLIFKDSLFMIPWGALIVIFGALGFAPKHDGWRGRVRLIGRTVLLFSVVLPLLAWAILFWGWRNGFDKWVNGGSIDFGVLFVMPWVNGALSYGLGGRRLMRVFFWTVGIVALPLAASFVGALDFFQEIAVFQGRADFVTMSWELMVFAAACGICLGLTHSEIGGSVGAGAARRFSIG